MMDRLHGDVENILVSILVLLSMSACYEPVLRDCTVSCETSADCATGQVCGNDGLCAAPRIAGSCAGGDVGVSIDAGASDAVLSTDVGSVIDAGFVDAETTVSLRVRISGKGIVAVDSHGECRSEEPQDGDCVYEIAQGVQRARALPLEVEHRFVGWTMGPCIDQLSICTFAAVGATTISAKFGKAGKAD
jgi:hypothetical protein